ncbi:MAG: hypothetical protein H6595_02080 [Flavobacteriales bacterium]|nr:hypothetical protein [Flavobacteriales bacterium]MCB9166246.1 hypothetical protein [Flavobacteriales bacterium]
MKSFLLTTALLTALPLLATDRVVEEFGQAPAYASITAAVSAAVDGDRIIIKNRAGNIPWIENITVAHSLDFLSYTNDDFFYVQGTYTIVGATGRTVTIVSMYNTSGSIAYTSGGTARGTTIRVLDGHFVNGDILLADGTCQAEIAGCTLEDGAVAFDFGKVVGCDIDASQTSAPGIEVSPGGSSPQPDTCAIIGNKVKSIVSYEGIFVNTGAQVVHIRNNYIQHGWMGIQVYGGNTTGVQNLIWNNTITAYTGQFTTYGIDMANTSAGSVWEIMNNVVTRTWSGTNRGINNDSGNQGQINVYYNHVSNNVSTPIDAGFTFTANNTTNEAITLNTDGTFSSAPSCIDGGNPAPVFFDLDLSIGDVGAYGGSYTLDNFFPLHTGAARVYLTGHPFNVRTGATLRVKGMSYDR